MPAFEAQVLDVGRSRLGYPKPVQGEQRDQRMLSRRPEPGGNQQRAELVAVGARLSRAQDIVGCVASPAIARWITIGQSAFLCIAAYAENSLFCR